MFRYVSIWCVAFLCCWWTSWMLIQTFQLIDLEQVLHEQLDLVVAHMNRYMYILCLFFTFTLGVLHNLLQQLKIACIVCRMSFARNDCPTTFWHWMHFPETWYPKWQTNYSDGLWTSCAQTSFVDIYHHQIGKSLFLGSKTEYFAESSRDE